MYVDAHCHLADPRFDSERDQVLERARAAGIGAFIQGGVGPEDWDRQLELKKAHPGRLFPTFGIHPWWVVRNGLDASRAALKRLPGYLDQGVGLGELGLDFVSRIPAGTHGPQGEIFRAQLALAHECEQPLVLHIVRAHTEALEILKEIGIPSRGGIVHAFQGSGAVARGYLDLGLCLSLGGAVASRKGFETLKRAVVTLPLDRVTIESDAPDQPPPGYEGRLNEPASIIEVAEAVARLKGKGLTGPQVLAASRENLNRIFRLC